MIDRRISDDEQDPPQVDETGLSVVVLQSLGGFFFANPTFTIPTNH